MQYFIRRPWDLPQSQHTPPEVYRSRKLHRREVLQSLGWTAAGLGSSLLLPGCGSPSLEELQQAGQVEIERSQYPAPRNPQFEYGRPETDQAEAARFTNFYEFSTFKSVYLHVGKFQPTPWQLEISGLCAQPRTFDLDELTSLIPLEERAYRFRCVETWAMCVPWTGYALHHLLKLVEPLPTARYVRFETFFRPEEASNQYREEFPWPYNEGLTIEEAMNELAFVATGIYGEPLLKQHGAPIRIVLPWKYGFKSIKSIVRIELMSAPPPTFWNSVNPHEYGFEANVDPNVPHPRWSQEWERMLGTGDRHRTVRYNGYGDWVGKLYS